MDMVEGHSYIPVIDFSDYGPNIADRTIDTQVLNDLGTKVKEAFKAVGFCYISNHGVEKEAIDNYLSVSREFFKLPAEIKQKYARPRPDVNFGWTSVERERLNPERPGDFKESYDFHPPDDSNNWPPELGEFQRTSRLLFEKCSELAHRICRVLSIGLGLDVNCLCKTHSLIGRRGNPTTLRSLYYPPISDNSTMKPGQVRLGEHTDYGSITVLFQDDIGGLEVEVPGVGFVPATPITGTAVVNIGDLMQRLTSDQLIATKHRVLVPEVELVKRSPRQSVAFFVHPDDDVMVECLDGSNKYEPITSLDYVNYRFGETYEL